MKRRILSKNQRRFIHSSLEKKSCKRCRFDGIVCHLLPLDSQRQGKKVFLSLLCSACFSLSLSLRNPKKPARPTLLSWPLYIETKKTEGTSLVEGLGEAAQWPPSHPTHSTRLDSGRVALPPYKYSFITR
jgi:hypothetical protein